MFLSGLEMCAKFYKNKVGLIFNVFIMMWFRLLLGLDRILFWPDIRYPAEYLAKFDIRQITGYLTYIKNVRISGPTLDSTRLLQCHIFQRDREGTTDCLLL